MRLAVCGGDSSNFAILDKEGLRRPYAVVTMDLLWWEAAAELGLPRMFFKNKLKMMKFCLGHDLICITTRDGHDETMALAASFETMGAVPLILHMD